MNLTLHLVASDLRRMRTWLACWVGLQLLPIAIGAMLMAQSPFDGGGWRSAAVLAYLVPIEIVVGFLITILLVQEHPVIGTAQFWVTRPISRARLLAAKAMGAVLMVVVLPVLVSLPWWLVCGFGPADVAGAAAERAALMAIMIICGALMATLTDSFGRAVLWTVVLIAGAVCALFFFFALNSLPLQDSHEMSLTATRSIILVVALLLEFTAIIVAQYFLRRYTWWLGVAAAAVVATVLFATQAPWSWFESRELPAVDAGSAGGFTVRIESARALPPNRRRPDSTQDLDISGVIDGAGSPLAVRGFLARQEWRLSDGTAITRESLIYGRGSPFRPATATATTFFIRAPLPRSFIARLAAEPASYSARLWLQLGHLERWFETPLGTSPWFHRGAHRIRMIWGRRDRDDVRVQFVETMPTRLRDSLLPYGRSMRWLRPNLEFPQFFVIDHARGEIGSLSGQFRRTIVSGVAIAWHDANLSSSGSRQRWTRLPEALASQTTGLTFAVAGWRMDAQFVRDVKVDRMEVEK